MSDANLVRHEALPAPETFDLDAALLVHEPHLQRYEALLRAATARQNLVGAATLADFHRRHVLDCAQLLPLAPDAKVWVDLGSGAGLPGLVLAILLANRPGVQIHLVESAEKKCRFLRSVAEELALPVEIHWARAESLEIAADIVTARACAPMIRLLEFASPYTTRGARGLFLKGASLGAELADARKRWRFRARIWPSLSDPRGQVVQVEGLRRAR